MSVRKRLQPSLIGMVFIAFATELYAQSLSVLHQFTAAPNDGASPYSEVIQGADGVLYGTTWSGGTNASGTVFSIHTDGSGFALLHHFGGENDGATPTDCVIQGADGFLYGTTYGGGTNGNGTIFKINTNGLIYSVLYRFSDSPDGANPRGSLLQGPDGMLYGTTLFGGSGHGTVFKINTNGSSFAVLHSFTNFTDATLPYGQLVRASNGLLYGTTFSGSAGIIGAVYQIDTNGANYTLIHSFNGTFDGYSPNTGLLIGQDGWLYGTTVSGGNFSAGQGTVFKLNTNGSVFTVLHTFTNSPDGANSFASLAQGNDGYLYGSTANGGTTNSHGTLFRVNTNGSNYSVLHRFNGDGDGMSPMAGLFTAGNGIFYGTALQGGSTNAAFGTVYRFSAPSTSPLGLTISRQLSPALTVTGPAGQACQIQVSSNLLDWTVLTNFMLTNGSAEIPDLTWTNSPTRFYRALAP